MAIHLRHSLATQLWFTVLIPCPPRPPDLLNQLVSLQRPQIPPTRRLRLRILRPLLILVVQCSRPDLPAIPNDVEKNPLMGRESLDFPSVEPLSALTDEVLVRTGTTQIMHAPTTDGPHCGQSGEFRHVDRQVVESHYRPCKDCFSVNG